MYIIIVGRHPLYVHGEQVASYTAKLKDPQWKFPARFSPLAQSLFLPMAQTKPFERYTAKEALSHPWITRRPGPLPLSCVEAIAFEQSRNKFRAALPVLFFASLSAAETVSEDYSQLVSF